MQVTTDIWASNSNNNWRAKWNDWMDTLEGPLKVVPVPEQDVDTKSIEIATTTKEETKKFYKTTLVSLLW